MADPTITIRVKGDTEDAEKKIGGLRGLISKLGENAPKALGAIGLGAAGLAAGAAAGIAKLATDAAKLEGVRNTFDSLTASIGTTSDSMLTTLRGATRGMVNDADLMQASNKFVAMGLAETEEEAAKLAEMATQLGMAMGEDATGSMENFALMMANQSIPRLDSFGISSGTVRKRIEELMESTEGMTREQAFMQAVMEEGQKTMEKVGDQSGNAGAKMAQLQASVDNAKLTIGQAFLPIMEKVLGVFAKLVEKWGPKIAEFFGKVGEFLDNFFGSIGDVSPLEALYNALVDIFGSEMAGTIMGTVDTVTQFLGQAWATFQAIFQTVSDTIMAAVETVWPTIQQIIGAVTTAVIGFVQENWPKIQAIIQTVSGIIMEIVNAVWPVIQETIMSVVNMIVGWVQANWPLIQATIDTVMTTISNIISTVLVAIKQFWTDHGETIIVYVTNAFNMIKGIIEGVILTIQGIIKAVMQIIQGDWEGAWDTIKETAKAVWDKIKGVIELAWENIKIVFQIAYDTVTGIFAKIGDWFMGIGRSIVDGLRSGISNAWDSFVSWVVGLLEGVKTKILQFFGIGSPSKMFVEIGENLMSGLAKGIGDGLEMPVTAMMQAGSAVQAAGAASAGSVTHNNYNLTIHSSAPAESALSDFHVMKALSGA